MNPATTRGLRRLKILRPLAIRDFALLWAGAAVSLLGDGVYIVTIAWQVYELSDTPTALSLIGVAWTLPMAAFLLVGGLVSATVLTLLVLPALYYVVEKRFPKWDTLGPTSVPPEAS